MRPELVDHRKFLRLKRLLGEPTPHVVGYLMMMWRRGYQTGNPNLGDELDIEAAAEYAGEPKRFATAALSAGFVERNPDGSYQIHDLFDHAPEWARKRMARNGYLPPGVGSYCGIKPGGRQAAAKPPADPPRGVEAKPAKAKDDPPAADPLTLAIVEVTGADPVVNAAHVGRVRKVLLKAEPPYTAAEVLKLAEPAFLTKELSWKKGTKLTLGEIEKFIGRVRNAGTPIGDGPKRGKASAADVASGKVADTF